MSYECPAVPSARESRPVLRIAVPSWRPGPRQDRPAVEETPRREDYQHLLDNAVRPVDVTILRLTKAERRQLSVSRRVRDALYGSAVTA